MPKAIPTLLFALASTISYYWTALLLDLQTPTIGYTVAILGGLTAGALLSIGMATPARDEASRHTSDDDAESDPPRS